MVMLSMVLALMAHVRHPRGKKPLLSIDAPRGDMAGLDSCCANNRGCAVTVTGFHAFRSLAFQVCRRR